MQDSIKFIPDYLFSPGTYLEPDDLLVLLQKLLAAILIGLLIGMEREHSKPEGERTFAGVRTFPIISILGFIAALLASFTSVWLYVSIFLVFGTLVISSHIIDAKQGRTGGTSEISILIVFVLGSLVLWNLMILAAIIGVIVNLFLTLKVQFHYFVGKINSEDLYATLKLAIISVIVFPLLPDETYGPLDVLNPRMIWMMIIFISGISFIGYLMIKFFGKDKGINLTGLMGGMVSSTAATISFSRKSRDNNLLSDELSIGVLLASTVMYPRIFFVTLVLNAALVSVLWLPLLIFTASGAILSFILYKKKKDRADDGNIEFRNPFELKSALLFGLIFGVVIFISKAAQIYLGSGGLIAAGAVAGITSVDAIVVSLAELALGGLSHKIVVAAIIIATVSNNIVKGIIVFTTGAKQMRKLTFTGLGILSVISLLYLAFNFLYTF